MDNLDTRAPVTRNYGPETTRNSPREKHADRNVYIDGSTMSTYKNKLTPSLCDPGRQRESDSNAREATKGKSSLQYEAGNTKGLRPTMVTTEAYKSSYAPYSLAHGLLQDNKTENTVTVDRAHVLKMPECVKQKSYMTEKTIDYDLAAPIGSYGGKSTPKMMDYDLALPISDGNDISGDELLAFCLSPLETGEKSGENANRDEIKRRPLEHSLSVVVPIGGQFVW